MSVTAKLLRVHRVDQQLRGLKSRVDGAQKFLDEQEKLLAGLQTKLDALQAQARQLKAVAHNDETELATIDARVGKLRDQMNSAKSNKEYSAFQVEIGTLKADREKIETRALESMSKLDEVTKGLATVETERTERKKIRDVAKSERDARQAEIKERLKELEAERAEAAKDVPAEALRALEAAVRRHEDDAMAAIEEHSRRNMDYSCGACQVMLPVELVSSLLSRGGVTLCSNCGAILYIEQELRESFAAGKR
jgi:predicted  nucleic acid-binding Zn-ribbon protein